MTNPIEAALPQPQTLQGDVRDLMLTFLTSQTALWKDMPEAQQKSTVAMLQETAGQVVTRIAYLVQTRARPAVLVTLDKISISGAEVSATIKVPKETAALLVPYAGQIVAIQPVGANEYMGERAPAQTMPDQPALPIGEVHAGALEDGQAAQARVIAAALRLVGTADEQYVPESAATLKLQQDALIEGVRHVQMFPTGTEPLPLPDGFAQLKTPRGVFHYNPDEIKPKDIKAASAKGEENLLLGYGPYSKVAVLESLKEGEKPFAICEVSSEGVEVRCAIASKATEKQALEAMRASAGPDNVVDRFSIQGVIDERLKAAAIAAQAATPPGKVEVVISEGGAGGPSAAPPAKPRRGGKRGSPF